MTNRLVLTVGLPRSGKSTWARSQITIPIVNPDAIRLALHGQRYLAEAETMVWAMAKYMVKALFLAGHQCVILDATNTTEKRREEWLSKEWETVLHIVPTNPDECKRRALACGQDDLIPVIDQMVASYDTPHSGWKTV